MPLSELSALLRAVARLHPEGDVDRDLVRALSGLLAPEQGTPRPTRPAHREEPRPSRAPSVGGASTAPSSAPRASSTTPSPTAEDSTAKTKPRDEDALDAIESVLELLTAQADLASDRRDARATASRERRPDADRLGVAAPVEALFPAGRVRAILRELSTVPAPIGQPDLAAAVGLIARGRPVPALPRRLVSALPKSILWLFDAGPSMLPYTRDKQQLARTVVRLLGDERVRIADFIADPRKGVRPRGQVTWQPLRWPGRHCTAVVVGDLGIGDEEMIDARAAGFWGAFIDEARGRGVGTVLLNPYDEARWPPVAHAFDLALTWDAHTRVQALRRTRRGGHPR